VFDGVIIDFRPPLGFLPWKVCASGLGKRSCWATTGFSATMPSPSGKGLAIDDLGILCRRLLSLPSTDSDFVASL